MRLPVPPARPLEEADDIRLLEAIAACMARIDPRSASGAPVLVADLHPRLAGILPEKFDLAAVLLRLERSDRLTLIRRDPALPATCDEEITCVRDGVVDVIGVALR